MAKDEEVEWRERPGNIRGIRYNPRNSGQTYKTLISNFV